MDVNADWEEIKAVIPRLSPAAQQEIGMLVLWDRLQTSEATGTKLLQQLNEARHTINVLELAVKDPKQKQSDPNGVTVAPLNEVTYP